MMNSILASLAVVAALPITNRIADVLSPAPLGSAAFGGPYGATLRRLLADRFLGDRALREILPEAEEAFRRRVDDRLAPGRGLWQGEFWGKWILGAVEAQRYTGDPRLRAELSATLDRLLAARREDGYIDTYHDSPFVRTPGEKANNWNV